MKKLFLTAAAVAALFSGAFAQSKSSSTASGAKLSVGLDFGLPVGDWKNAYSIAFGGNGKVEIPVASAFNFTVTAGYTSLYAKDANKAARKALGIDTYNGYIPVKAGGKLFLGENFYAEGELGARFGTNLSTGTAFIYAPGLGFSFPVSDKHDIDFGARYEGWSQDGGSVGMVGFRFAYKFGL